MLEFFKTLGFVDEHILQVIEIWFWGACRVVLNLNLSTWITAICYQEMASASGFWTFSCGHNAEGAFL